MSHVDALNLMQRAENVVLQDIFNNMRQATCLKDEILKFQ